MGPYRQHAAEVIYLCPLAMLSVLAWTRAGNEGAGRLRPFGCCETAGTAQASRQQRAIVACVEPSSINFQSEFVNSPAVLAANDGETMGKILSRLDQLQAKVT